MKIITFATMKGGTGKTTLSYNVAAELAKKYKVLVMDFDSQCNLSSNFGMDIFDESLATVADLFEDFETDPMNMLIPAPLDILPNLDLIPSTMYLYGTELMLSTRSYREQILKKYIKKNENFFEFYDYIIFDTAPNLGLINQNAFFASDHILLVTDPDTNSAKGADVFMKLWDGAREMSGEPNKVDGFILNNVERTRMTSKLEEYVQGHEVLSKIRFNTQIPHTTRFKECGDQNLPIHYLKTKNSAEEKSRKRADDVIVMLVEEMKERGII